MSSVTESGGPTELSRLKRRLERARAARLEMEAISERSLRELYLREQELRLLQEVATLANLSHSMRDVFQDVLTRVCEFMAWPVGHVYLADNESDPVRLKSMTLWHARDFKQIDAFRSTTVAQEFVPEKGLPGRVYSSGKPIWLADVTSDDSFARQETARENNIRSACAFPIFVDQEVAAVFEFFTDRRLEPNEPLLAILPQIGTHLGRSIERQRAEDRLIHDASHDPLTGLPNRMLFLDRLDQAISRKKRNPKVQFAVLFIDLDRFKIVNDGLGHLAGDGILASVANRLKDMLDSDNTTDRSERLPTTITTTLARLGGDEFTILIEDIRDVNDAAHIANRVQSALRQPFIIKDQEIHTTASIGIALSASDYATTDAMLRDADLAMYRAKSLGKARFELFDLKMHEAAMQRLSLETDLRRALRNQEFVLHYQPIVSLQTNAVVGFEALVRWQRPQGELVYPEKFIHVMEDTGLIVTLGHWVLREACEAIHQLQKQSRHDEPLTISVNFSPRQFAQRDLVEKIRSTITECGIDPHWLRLEVTESVMIDDTQRVARVLKELEELGVRLSIDDFGTGYSSLSYLQSLPFDILKIDQSFIEGMGKNPESLKIVQTILNLARGLNLEVVAEGAEIAGQVSQLKTLGCEFYQGYYFSRPVDFSGATSLLKRSGVYKSKPPH